MQDHNAGSVALYRPLYRFDSVDSIESILLNKQCFVASGIPANKLENYPVSVEPIISSPLEIKPKMTLPEILLLMQAADEGMALLSIEEMELLADKLEDKVDGYKFYIEKCESEAARLDMRIKAFTDAKRAINGRIANLEKLLAIHMAKHEFPFLRGNDWKAVLTRSKAVEVTPAPTSELYLEYSDFMRLKYEWNKVALTAALKAGDEKAAKIASRVESIGCKFAVNKGAALDD